MSKRPLAVLMLLLIPTSGLTGPVEQCSCDPNVEIASLRQHIEAQRDIPPSFVELEFTAVNAAFTTYFSFPALRGTSCPYVLDDGVSGLIDILLRAKPVVGYPQAMADYRPEARFAILFRVNQEDEFDLWFSNPLHTHLDPTPVLLGQSHDFATAVGYKISADGALRNELLKWAQAHGHPQRIGGRCPPAQN
jgi:hypothetical protein